MMCSARHDRFPMVDRPLTLSSCLLRQVAAVLLALVACAQSGSVLLRAAPYAPLTYAAPYAAPYAPLTYAHAAPVVYSAPKVTNVEIPTPVVTKTNLNVLTDEDKISTTEVSACAVA